MRTAVLLLRALILVVLVWFAAKNSDPVKLRGFLDQSWEAPLVFVLLIVFVGGVVLGLLAWVPTVVRQRREVARLKKTLAQSPMPLAPDEPPHGI
jgi:lipopolysaccharide assembly protein A